MKNIFKYILALLFLTFSLSYFNSQITANSLNVELDKPNNKISYNFNFSGTFYKVETTLYKNSVSSSNIIAYGIKEDESDYANIIYPPGYIYSDFMNQQNSSAYGSATQYILVINAWEKTTGSVANFYTETLSYTPPAPLKPDFSIYRVQIFRDKFNTNDYSHLFFDSQNLGQYPGSALNKGVKYKFLVTVYNSAAFPSQNPILTLSQGLIQSGTYPNGVSKSIDITVPMTNTNLKTVEFFETIISPSQDMIPAYLAYHINKNNSISETDANNNYKIQQTYLYPTNYTIAGKIAGSKEIVKVFNENGKLLKEYMIGSDDKVEKKIIEDFGYGNYYLQSENNVSRRVKITK